MPKTNFPIPECEAITSKNVHRLQHIQTLSYGMLNKIAMPPDEKYIAVATTRNVWIHHTVTLDDLPTQLSEAMGNTLDVLFTTDSAYIITIADNRVRIRTTGTFDLQHELATGDVKPTALAIHKSTLFVGFDDGHVQEWSCDTWQKVREMPFPQSAIHKQQRENVYIGMPLQVKSLAISDDGVYLAVMTTASLVVFDLSTLEVKANPSKPLTLQLRYVAFASDHRTLVIHGQNPSIWWYFYDADTGEHIDFVTATTWNGGTSDGTPSSRNNIWNLKMDSPKYTHVLENSDGTRFICSSSIEQPDTFYIHDKNVQVILVDGQLAKWHLGSASISQRSAPCYGFTQHFLAFSPDGKRLSGWDIRHCIPLEVPPKMRYHLQEMYREQVVYDVNGRLVNYGGGYHNFVMVDMYSGKPVFEMPLSVDNKPHKTFVMSDNCKKVISGGSLDQGLYLWDLESGDKKRLWYREGQAAIPFSMTNDNRYVAAVTNDRNDPTINKTLRIFELKTHEEIFSLRPVHNATFTPKSNTILVSRSGKQGRRAEIWNFRTQKLLGTFHEPSVYLQDVTFSADGFLLFLPVYQTEHLEVWDWQSSQQLSNIPIPQYGMSGGIFASALSPDETVYAIAYGSENRIYLFGVSKSPHE